jgi:hypothetical protein
VNLEHYSELQAENPFSANRLPPGVTRLLWSSKMLNPFKRYGLALLVVYGLYLAKSASGINISSQYSAPDIFKLPIHDIMEAHARDPKAFRFNLF